MIKGPTPQRAHILIIEDNPADVELVRLALQSAGVDCELIVIDDGAEALAFVHQVGKYSTTPSPDLAIIDLNLPKHGGFEILEEMHAGRFSELPILVLSSSSLLREHDTLAKFRVARFVTKPPDLEEFLRIGTIVKELLVEATHLGGDPRS